MKQRFILSILFTVVFIGPSFSQWKESLADKHFNNLAYFEAAPLYNELADKFLSEQKGKQDFVLRAAISNAKIGEYKKSNEFFAKLLNIDNKALSEGEYMLYIDQLRMLEQYKEARIEAGKAHELYPNNPYFLGISNDKDALEEIKAQERVYEIKLQDFNTGYGDFSPFFYENGLLFTTKSMNRGFLVGRFSWDNSFFTNVVYTEVKDGKWKKPKLQRGAFFSAQHSGPVAFNQEYDKMLITKNLSRDEKKKGVRYSNLYLSSQVEGEWEEPEVFPYGSTAFNTGHGVFSVDGKRVYFSSDREGGKGGSDIYYSDFVNEEWQEPVNLERINTSGNEMFPFVSSDNMLYFASNGHVGLGGLDIYMLDLDDESSSPLNLGAGINSSADDFSLIVDSTGLSGYLTSNRDGFVDNIYSWYREAIRLDVEINVFAHLREGKVPLEKQEVFLVDNSSGDTLFLESDENGQVKSPLELFKKYEIGVLSSEDYDPIENISFTTRNVLKDTSFLFELNLYPVYVDVELLVFNEKTKKPLKNARIDWINRDNQESVELFTDDEGKAYYKADKQTLYRGLASIRGYMDGQGEVKTGARGTALLEIGLVEIKRGLTFKIDNILYDLNKATLRPESKDELDKLAVFLLTNEGIKVELSSHTDSRGSDAYNRRLSQQRAQSCVNYLIEKGVNRRSLVARGYGEARLINRCKNGVTCSEEEHQENRRTEIKVLGIAGK